VNDVKGTAALTDTLSFRLGTLGAIVSARFAAAVEAYGVKPKHVGLMAVLSSGTPASQQELAATMNVAPSLVVALADQLESLGAIERVRDPDDRRRQKLSLTGHGQALLADCTQAARALDAELTASLAGVDRAALHRALATLAGEAGLPR
jgi:DNA-binding MarR family transcriptional regulator